MVAGNGEVCVPLPAEVGIAGVLERRGEVVTPALMLPADGADVELLSWDTGPRPSTRR